MALVKILLLVSLLAKANGECLSDIDCADSLLCCENSFCCGNVCMASCQRHVCILTSDCRNPNEFCCDDNICHLERCLTISSSGYILLFVISSVCGMVITVYFVLRFCCLSPDESAEETFIISKTYRGSSSNVGYYDSPVYPEPSAPPVPPYSATSPNLMAPGAAVHSASNVNQDSTVYPEPPPPYSY